MLSAFPSRCQRFPFSPDPRRDPALAWLRIPATRGDPASRLQSAAAANPHETGICRPANAQTQQRWECEALDTVKFANDAGESVRYIY
jgi:hypothetical protein